ncbi:hypothetical protein KI387_037177 [Taxus chinensis]|uniref:Uncharacterized protein n=1 Tax=Taxus chinensis TaxID=29808 RepID=A0AA38FRX6_TAXCH|nr:hypothetical protein KI387_037177 [Taxus chinensis]
MRIKTELRSESALTRARRGDGPTLVECETYQFRGHSLADPDELQDPAEKAHYAERDPVVALKTYLIENNLVKESNLKSIEKKIDDLVKEAVEFADTSPLPERGQLLENVFADPKGFGICPDGRDRGGSVSYQNIHEAQFALQLYEHLQRVTKLVGIKVSVGIITPYKLQLKCLHRYSDVVLKSDEGKGLYINTVVAFLCQEHDVIIMSCVRASNHGVGFVADVRRMNVALTRACRELWVMGNTSALQQSSD